MRKKERTDPPDVNAKQKALDLLLYRTRTEKELYDKLLERGYSENESAEALEYVRHFGYVNDEDYAKHFVSSHSRSEGRYSLKRRMAEKGLDEDTIREALDELPEEEETIKELLLRKLGTPHPLNEREYRRIYGFLIRHGFKSSGIRNALNDYQNGQPGEES